MCARVTTFESDEAMHRRDEARNAMNPDLHRAVLAIRVKLAEHEFGTAEELVADFGDDEADLYWTREEDIDEEFPD
jgi:hypothetical protein